MAHAAQAAASRTAATQPNVSGSCGLDFVELRPEHAAQGGRGGAAERDAGCCERQRGQHHGTADLPARGSQRDTDADLAGALPDRVGDHAVHAHRGEHQRQGRESTRAEEIEALG